MKCQNCGKEEVNFHFTSNINGNITEKHLCAECAGKLGYSEKSQVRQEASLEDIFTELFSVRPNKRMVGGYGLVIPTFIIPTMGMLAPDTGYNDDDDDDEDDDDDDRGSDVPQARVEIKPVIDVEMQKRREVNILRDQMKKAAESEEFEKAAALRDSIKMLEKGENS